MYWETKIYWETLPDWVWLIYYSFILATLGFAAFSIVRKKMIILSWLSIMLAMTMPVIGIIYSIGRDKGVDEFEHFVMHLQQGSPWSIYVASSFLYLLVWWVIFLLKQRLTVQKHM